MSVTIEQRPDIGSGVYDAAIFVLSESDTYTFNWRYKVTVRTDSSSGDIVAIQYVVPNGADAGVFDLSKVYQSYVRSNPDYQSGSQANVVVNGNRARKFHLSFQSEFSSTADAPVQTNTAVTTEHIVIPGSLLDYSDSYSDDPIQQFKTVNVNGYWLTMVGQRYNEQNFNVRTNDDGVLCYIQGNTDGLSTANYINWKYDNSATIFTAASTNAAPTADNIIRYAQVFPAGLEAQTEVALGKPSVNGTWRYYDVYLSSDSGGLTKKSRTYRFHKVSDCVPYHSVRFMWANRLGGWDYLSTSGKITEKQSVERTEYRKIRGNYYTANGDTTAWEYSSRDRGLQSAPRKHVTEFTAHTGPLTNTEALLLADMIRSNDVYVQLYQPVAKTDFTFYPCVVLDTNFDVKTQRQDGLFEYAIRYRMSNEDAVRFA